MMDLFDTKNIKPMLLSEMHEPFNSPDFIYELKLDGIRSIVYLSSNGTDIRNRENKILNSTYPEIMDIHKQANGKCILDGEIAIIKNGIPDFQELYRRSIMTNKFKIELASEKLPVSYTAFDILYLDGRQLKDLPLLERKEILKSVVVENDHLAVSRYIPEKGIELFDLTIQNGLEGIVAKHKDSKYQFDKASKNWIKIKNLIDDDFIICGYIPKENNKVSLILGERKDGVIHFVSHVSMGVSKQDYQFIKETPIVSRDHYSNFPNKDGAVWLKPQIICTVTFMQRTVGGLRRAVFKGIRNDKSLILPNMQFY